MAWDYADLDVDLQLKLAPLWMAKNGLNRHCDVDLKLMLAPIRGWRIPLSVAG